MSTVADPGGKGAADALLADAKALVEAAEAEELRQLDMLPPSAEEMADARAELGPDAGRLTVLRVAREKRRGRPAGARNKRTDDFARYILAHGPDPAVTLAQIQGTPPEVLMEASRRRVTKLKSGGKDKPDELVTFEEETLSYEGALSLRVRCAEALLPFVHSKRPVAIDATIRGVRIVEEIGGHDTLRNALEGEFVRVATGPIDGEDAA